MILLTESWRKSGRKDAVRTKGFGFYRSVMRGMPRPPLGIYCGPIIALVFGTGTPKIEPAAEQVCGEDQSDSRLLCS